MIFRQREKKQADESKQSRKRFASGNVHFSHIPVKGGRLEMGMKRERGGIWL